MKRPLPMVACSPVELGLGAAKAGAKCRGPKKLKWTAGLLACGDPFGGQRYDSKPSRSAKKLFPRYSKTEKAKSANSWFREFTGCQL
jgi:hypothetical protein